MTFNNHNKPFKGQAAPVIRITFFISYDEIRSHVMMVGTSMFSVI
ncbi:hypothetical protein FHS16_006118 [Paenibacillus endophyticus]|uniref:Uncharacterized protein n=1 Tax=Paenibacillus endophyticus TaxID=1294268 RepID=A0A7W5CE23_9BACL|nr:hypothetical protein [Paenibacillus endophyticus]